MSLFQKFKDRVIRGAIRLSDYFDISDKDGRPVIKPEKTPIEDTGKPLEPEPNLKVEAKERIRVSGYNVQYQIPEDMRKLRVRLLKSNGAFLREYELTKYLDIDPGSRVQLLVDKD